MYNKLTSAIIHNKTITIVLVISLLIYNFAFSQHFEWAASASNVDLSYSFSSVDFNNNIVVGGHALRNFTHKGKTEIYDAKGEILPIDNYLNEEYIVLSYSPEGKVNWNFTLNSRFSELNGITHDGNGNTILLINVLAYKYIEGENFGAIPEINNRNYILSGYYLLYINSDGSYLKKQKIFSGSHTNINISAINAAEGDELEVEAGKAGGDFLLVLDENGIVNWADVVSYNKETCCSYYSQMCEAAISPDGTIYLGGTYKNGGTFGGNTTIISSQKNVNGQDIRTFETYVASYSPAGKLNWVKTSK